MRIFCFGLGYSALQFLRRQEDVEASGTVREAQKAEALAADGVDAFVFDVVNGPRDAYVFARGGEVGMTPVDIDRKPTRTWKLRRPLDFTAVTDHSEGFGVTRVCRDPTSPAYSLPECQLLNGIIPTSALPNPSDVQFALHKTISQATLLLLIASVGVPGDVSSKPCLTRAPIAATAPKSTIGSARSTRKLAS